MPEELINPKSTLTGKTPEMREVTNWYFSLEGFRKLLTEWVDKLDNYSTTRSFAVKSIKGV